jgi:hypothetical protein
MIARGGAGENSFVKTATLWLCDGDHSKPFVDVY